jgi:uncharacterized protein (DUF1501 family)
LKNLYNSGELAFIAGIGGLVEPVTKADYQGKSGLAKTFPPSLFAHNIMQRSMHNVHAQFAAAKGVLGRAVQSLTTQASPYRSELYSLIGNSKMLEGSKTPRQLNRDNGMPQFNQFTAMRNDLEQISKFVTKNPFGENWAAALESALNQTEEIGARLDATTLDTPFGDDVVSKQLLQVSKIVKLRTEFETERDVFIINRGSYDTHGTFDLSPMFQVGYLFFPFFIYPFSKRTRMPVSTPL